jgi:hypothetical protein
MNTIKYRFKQIQKLGKLFGESHLTNIYILVVILKMVLI